MLDESKFVLQVYVILFESTEMKMVLENAVFQYWSYLTGTQSFKLNEDRVNQALKEMYYILLFQVNTKGPNPVNVYSFTISSYPFAIMIINVVNEVCFFILN